MYLSEPTACNESTVREDRSYQRFRLEDRWHWFLSASFKQHTACQALVWQSEYVHLHTLSRMTNSHELTRQCVFLEIQLWKTTPESLRSWGKAVKRTALSLAASQHPTQRAAPLPTNSWQRAGSYTTRVYIEWYHLAHLISSFGVAKHEVSSVPSVPRDRAIPSAVFMYVESRSARSLLHLSPLLQSLVLSSPTSSPTHTRTHTHTGGGAQHHSGACARPLRALQRRCRCMVASRHWTILANCYPNRYTNSTLALHRL